MRALWMACLALCAAPGLRAEPLELDPSGGAVRAILYKDGLLKALGHDHVVEARSYAGQVEVWGSSASARLELRAEDLEIDAAETRKAERLKRKVSDKDRAKIRETMLGPKGLESSRYPLIAFRTTSAVPDEGRGGVWKVSGDLSLHGRTLAVELSMTVEDSPEGLVFSGELPFRLDDYGIKPFSLAGGMIKVKNEALFKLKFLGRRRKA